MDKKAINKIFALDIGTRTVVGILGVVGTGEEVLDIVDVEVMEHPDRNMFDGQIHDISRVAQVVKEVKGRLEDRNSCELNHVCIAAAGRALITHRSRVDIDVEGRGPADKMLISSLELKAMQKSQEEIEKKYNKEGRYFCVGYSVVNYFLDGVIIKNLEGHRGSTMGVEVISTFLPRTVVDSLYTVMERVDLEVMSLTLEPIAAINVAIPENLRLLNLAMIDIGAGTSDIAITRSGTITAYSMVAIAGDEITEEIGQHFLTDFNTAERIKIEASRGKSVIEYRDVLGNQLQVDRQEVLNVIHPVVDRLAQLLSDKIVEYNQGPPSAVFCIGGGSQIPGLKEALSSKLSIPLNRIGIKGLEEIKGLKISAKGFSGPDAVTPVGIALSGYRSSGDHFINITVNDKALRLLNTKEITVRDALLATGFNPRKLIPGRGPSVKFYINGKVKEIKGQPGNPAIVKVNGREAGLSTVLKDGDTVNITEATEGKKASPTIGEVVHKESRQIILSGKKLTLMVGWRLNGERVSPSTVIKDGDRLEISCITTLGELIDLYELPKEDRVYKVNGKEVSLDYELEEGDSIDVIEKAPEAGQDKAFMEVMVNGEKVKLPVRGRPYIFVDIFNYIDFDLSNPKGKIELTINGNRASYTDVINEGDSICITWK